MGHSKNKSQVFNGKISNVDVDYPQTGYPILIIKGIQGIEMTEEAKSKIHKNKKVSDVIKAIHGEAGISIEVEDSKEVMKHIPQSKETNAEFTHKWKEKLGWKYYKKPTGNEYYFGTKDLMKSPVGKLGWRTGGLEIISFKPSFVDSETERKEDEKQLENKKGKKKDNKYKKAPSKKAGSSGSDKVSGKA